MNQNPFIIERKYNAHISKVWKAITTKEDMKAWYFDLAELKAEVGFTFQFEGGPPEKSYLHICEITEVVPEQKLTYSWRYDGYAGKSFVTFELFDEGDQTRLRLTHKGLETFPKENLDLAQENFAAGWNEIIGTNLQEFLEKGNSSDHETKN